MPSKTNKALIVDEIRSFIMERCFLDEALLAEDAALFSSGVLNSADLVNIALFIEEIYSIGIDGEEVTVESFDTLANMAGYIVKKTTD